MNTYGNTRREQATLYGLAVAGFIFLIGAGMWLAIYSNRFVPTVVTRVGSAAVYLSSLLPKRASLAVVTNAPTIIPFGDAGSTTPRVSTTSPVVTKPKTTTWTPGTPVPVTIGTQPSSVPTTAVYSGLPDLAVSILAIGYAPTASTTSDSIVATTTIPARSQLAVKFRVTNVGTNVSGPWTMTIAIPTSGSALLQAFTQASLAPGQPSEYIARFDNITPGADRAVVITLDPNHQLSESSVANNTASTTVTVLGN